jgi:hypothetical protein
VPLAEALARVAEIRSLAVAAAPAPPARVAAADGFAGVLGGTSAGPGALAGPAPVAGAGGGSPAAEGIVRLAQGEVGVREQPPGSNEGPRIAAYREATTGSGVGPWCAYFTSWVAREAGVPVGESGQGFGAVRALHEWAQRAGRALPAGATPRPGDLIVWDQHIGVVEGVDAQGRIHTIEGNSSDAVTRRTYDPGGGGAVGYVRLA